MPDLLAVLLLALLWSLFWGELSLFNLSMGSLLALLLLGIVRRDHGKALPQRLLAFLYFTYRFLIELILANIALTRLAFHPRPNFHPHIIAVPLRLQSNAAISLLSATITLLPGTVAMGVSADKRILYAHAIGEADIAKARRSVSAMEKLILGFME